MQLLLLLTNQRKEVIKEGGLKNARQAETRDRKRRETHNVVKQLKEECRKTAKTTIKTNRKKEKKYFLFVILRTRVSAGGAWFR